MYQKYEEDLMSKRTVRTMVFAVVATFMLASKKVATTANTMVRTVRFDIKSSSYFWYIQFLGRSQTRAAGKNSFVCESPIPAPVVGLNGKETRRQKVARL